MIEAIVVDWNDSSKAGVARSSDGQDFRLYYLNGRSFLSCGGQPIPMLTRRHEQPAGGQLKMPAVGDAVLLQLPASDHLGPEWGYMRTYLELVERRFGTTFRYVTKQN